MKGVVKFFGFGCLGFLSLVIVLSIVGAGLDDELQKEVARADISDPIGSSEDIKPNEPEQRKSNWRYSEQFDQMRDANSYFAIIKSENTVDFGFPYSGSQRMAIQLRKSPAFGKDIIFSIEKGQIVCNVYDCIGNISFDGKSEKLTLARAADGTSTVGFARYPDALARKFKSSEKVIVELTFYQEGTRQFVFEAGGLEWRHF